LNLAFEVLDTDVASLIPYASYRHPHPLQTIPLPFRLGCRLPIEPSENCPPQRELVVRSTSEVHGYKVYQEATANLVALNTKLLSYLLGTASIGTPSYVENAVHMLLLVIREPTLCVLITSHPQFNTTFVVRLIVTAIPLTNLSMTWMIFLFSPVACK
jgi:hypothetical protein